MLINQVLERFSTGSYNTDMHCPRDGEMVNTRCWKCGWERDIQERFQTISTLLPELPVDHRPVAAGDHTNVIGGCSCGTHTPAAASEFATHIRLVRRSRGCFPPVGECLCHCHIPGMHVSHVVACCRVMRDHRDV